MAHMGQPKPRAVFLTILLALTFYGALLPVWLAAREPYACLVTRTATALLPLFGIHGSVTASAHTSISLTYVLEDPRTGGWGGVKQRHLNVPDLPLAIALAGSLFFLPWRRRLLVLLESVLFLFLLHLSLVVATAIRLSAHLQNLGLSGAELESKLYRSAEAIAAYRDVAPGVVVVIVGLLAALTGGKSSHSAA